MRYILLNLLCGCFLGLQCFAGNIEELDGKLYLSPGSVYVAPDAIYVNINGQFISVKSIASDFNGIYTILDSSETGLFGDTWTCPKPSCGYENYTAINKCAICGTEKPKK